MTQLWIGEDRKAVTKIAAGPAVITQLKTTARDGYAAVQLSFGEKKRKNIAKSILGHLKNFGPARWLREFRVQDEDLAGLNLGDVVKVGTFAVGDKVSVTGWSKGRGFAGVVKRHGFHGQDTTHGTKDQVRMPGSIGAGGVQRVFKGVRMAGHMGNQRVTSHNIEIVKIDEVDNLIYLAGSVPGARGGLVFLRAAGELKAESGSITDKAKEVEPTITQNDEAAQIATPEVAAVEVVAPTEAEVVEVVNDKAEDENAAPNT